MKSANNESILSQIVEILSRATSPVSTSEICDQIATHSHSVRARLSERAGKEFFRIGRGLYAPIIKGQAGIQGDSLEILTEMADAGHRLEHVTLDIPYHGNGVKGGNRDIADFEDIDPEYFGKALDQIDRMIDEDTPVVFIFSNGKSSRKVRQKYQAEMDRRFKLVREYTYQKQDKSGRPVRFGRHQLPTEAVLIYTRSGKVLGNPPKNLEIAAQRPWRKYPTQKPVSLLEKLYSIFTRPGQTILDPFAGSGSSGIAAAKMRLKSVLIDKAHNPLHMMRRLFGFPSGLNYSR